MTVKSSGPLKQSEITTEFGGSAMQVHKGQTWYAPGDQTLQTEETFGPGLTEWYVPLHAGTITWEIVGGGGGGGGNDQTKGHDGYPGAKLTGVFDVASGNIVKISVGGGGDGGPFFAWGNGVRATGGYHVSGYNGGAGGLPGNYGASGGGGGGGAASVLYINNVPYAIAGGGGGGGGAGLSSSGRDAQAFVTSGNNAGGAGADKGSGDGGGGGGGGGGYQGASGGALTAGDSGGYSGGTGTNLVPTGWTVSSANNNGIGGTYNGTLYGSGGSRGTDGYVKVTYTAIPLTFGSFPQKNLRFSLFYNKRSSDPAGADLLPFVTPGTYNCIVPLHRNQVTIDLWGGGGGTYAPDNQFSKGGDTTVSWGNTVLTAGGGYNGGGGGRRYIGPGGAGGTATGGAISENGEAGIGGGAYNSNSLRGGNAGGQSYGGGQGGLGGGEKWSYGAPAVSQGDNGGKPGGGTGGLFVYDYSPAPGFSGFGGGGGGGFVRAVITDLPQNTTLTINVGQGSTASYGTGGDGKVIVSWS